MWSTSGVGRWAHSISSLHSWHRQPHNNFWICIAIPMILSWMASASWTIERYRNTWRYGYDALMPLPGEWLWISEIKSSQDRVHVVLNVTSTTSHWWLHFILPEGAALTCTCVRNLGTFDQARTLKDHVSHLVRSCLYQLHRIKAVHMALPILAAIQLVNSFIIS